MKLILMTRPDFFIEEHQILTALFEEGLDTLHLRKPNTEPVLSERLVSLIPEGFRKKIVVHDHFYLKHEYGLKGIHLNARNSQLPNNYKGHISCSCHTEEELSACASLSDYMFLSPIYNSISKTDFHEDFNLERLAAMKRRKFIHKKVMAFGGIGEENIPDMKRLGFGGVVVLGDIWNRFNIHTHSDYKEIIHHFRKLRKLTD